ncbi:MAG: hypothetical protein LBL47_01235 [Lactobacillus sp.]|jgi:phosphoglucosamine mutase|nr:hypothetical protein [Lactobacillus sp.]
MARLFGTDGIRGVAGQWPMVPEFALKLAKAAGVKLATKHKKVAICRDTRISGQMLESAMAAGFASVGVDVVSLGVLPTPAMSNIVADLGVDLAVIITASHNPYGDNGIKLINGDGYRFDKELLYGLEDMVAGDELACTVQMGSLAVKDDAEKAYIDRIMQILPGNNPLKGLKVVVDCANGAFYDILPMVYKHLGAGVITLGNEPDGYNINKDSGSLHPENMCDTVVKGFAHMGIAVDGDGDRIIVCDETGKVIDGDQIIAFLANTLKEQGKLGANTVVTNPLSNPGLGLYLKSKDVNYVKAGMGEPNIIVKMQELGSNVGGEECGHIVLLDYAKSGDALATSMVVAYGLLQSGKKMSEIFPMFPFMPKKRHDVKFAKKENMQVSVDDEKVKAVVAECEAVLGERGRIMVRPSGTEPKVQVWVWGENPEQVDELNAKIVAEIEKFAS